MVATVPGNSDKENHTIVSCLPPWPLVGAKTSIGLCRVISN